MGWTRRQFVVQAFEEIGYASYVYDLESEQLESAGRRLDAMVSTWNGKGIRLGYPLPSSPEIADLDAETEVPDYANEAIYVNLALRVAPTVGKSLSPETKILASATYKLLLQRAARPLEQQLPDTMPSGAGKKPWRNNNNSPFLRKPRDPLLAGEDGPIEFN